MSWNRLWKPSAGLAALMIVALPGTALAATLVVRSSGPSAKSYPAGMALAPEAKIALKTGDQVVILDGRGTRTLKGPGSFSPTIISTPAVDQRTTFTAMVTQRNARRARIGAVRGFGGPAEAAGGRSPNIWFVDIERSSTACVADPAKVTLWRSDQSRSATTTVTGPDGKSEAVSWMLGQSSKPWPAGVPISAGGQYRITWAGAPQPTVLTFAILGPNPPGLEDMAAALIRNGCDAQLDLLIETVSGPDPKTAPAG